MEKNFKSNVLKKFGENLMEYGFTVQKIKDEEVGLETLQCGFFVSEKQQQPLVMDITFYELDTNPILQFYVYIANNLPDEVVEQMKPVIEEYNTYTPVGHMGIYEEEKQLYYRYSLIFEENEKVETAVDRCETVMELMLLLLKANYEKFEIKEK